MKKITLLCIILFFYGCSQQENSASDAPINILATINDEEITVDDINEYLLTLPSKSRWANSNQKEWLINIIQSLAVKKTLLKEAQLANFDKYPSLIQESNKIERILYSNYFIQQNKINIEISDTDLEDYYNDHIKDFNLPEQRVVHHIFKEFKNNKEQINQELSDIIKRINNRENFILLAEENSDSETRHNNGLIGTVKKGDLSSDFDKIIFNLKKNKPSEIITTKQGAHIFMVMNILEEKIYPFSAVKNKIRKILLSEKSINLIKDLALELPQSDEFIIIDEEKLQKVTNQAGNNVIILQVGDFKLNIKQFSVELNEVRESLQGIDVKNLPYLVFQEIAYRQIIYNHVKSNINDFNFPDTLKTTLKSKKAEKKLEIYSNIKLYAYLNKHPEIVNEYFKENEMRFSSSVIIGLALLKIPMQNNEGIMPLLEQSIKKLNSSKMT